MMSAAPVSADDFEPMSRSCIRISSDTDSSSDEASLCCPSSSHGHNERKVPTVITLNYPAVLEIKPRVSTVTLGNRTLSVGSRIGHVSLPPMDRFATNAGLVKIRQRRTFLERKISQLNPFGMELPRPVGVGFSKYLESQKIPDYTGVRCRSVRRAQNAYRKRNEMSGFQLYSQKMIRLRMVHGGNNRPVDAEIPFLINRATTTPTGPYSNSSDLLHSYGADPSPRFPSPDEFRNTNGSLAELDRRRTQERRPPSRKDSRKTLAITSREKALSIEREKGQKDAADSKDVDHLPNSYRNNYFKPNGVRSTYLGGQQVSPAQRAVATAVPSATPSRESEDLVAMGTNWTPPNLQQIRGRTSTGNGGNFTSISSGLSHQLSVTQAPTVSGPRRVGRTNSLSQISGARQSRHEAEPKYSDPLSGASPSFQQRISELASLEAETIRWERTRKIKKKPKET